MKRKEKLSTQMQKLNRKEGIIKKKLGVKGKVAPGELISKSKSLSKKMVAIMGLV